MTVFYAFYMHILCLSLTSVYISLWEYAVLLNIYTGIIGDLSADMCTLLYFLSVIVVLLHQTTIFVLNMHYGSAREITKMTDT